MSGQRPLFPRRDYASLRLYAPDREPAEVDLSDNTNLWGPHPAALQAVREATAAHLSRYPTLYADDLRAAAAERLGVAPENIGTGCGSDDVLDSAFRAAAEEGGSVAYATPTFVMVGPLTRMNGREQRPVSWVEAMADPAKLFVHDPVLVYLCRPNNPTGTMAPRLWMLEVLEAAGDDGPIVLVDEAYAEYAGEKDSLVGELPRHPRLLIARTLSKAFGLAGLRVGYCVGQPEVVAEVEKARCPFKVNRFAELAGAVALRDEEGWIESSVGECLENRERLSRCLQERGLAPLPSRTNFVFLPVAKGEAVSWARQLRARGVAVRPFHELTEVGGGLRISVGPWSLMERFLVALDQVLEDAEGAAAGSLETGVERDGGSV